MTTGETVVVENEEKHSASISRVLPDWTVDTLIDQAGASKMYNWVSFQRCARSFDTKQLVSTV